MLLPVGGAGVEIATFTQASRSYKLLGVWGSGMIYVESYTTYV